MSVAKSAVEHAGTTVLIMAPDQKGLQDIFGIPAVRRLALMSRQMGFQNIHIIGQSDSLRPYLDDMAPPVHFHEVADPGAVAAVVGKLSFPDGACVLAMRANHVLDKPTLSRFLEKSDPSTLNFMESKGKNGSERIYFTPPRYLLAVLHDLWRPSSGNGLPGIARHVGSLDGLPVDLDGSGTGKRQAEAALLKSLAFQTRDSDGFLARHISRRISRPISRRIAYFGVTPDQITFFGALIGLIAAAFFGFGGHRNQLVGSLLFVVCVIIDGIDGEIARLKLRESPRGHTLDVVMDNVVHVAVFTGIALGLYRDFSDPRYLYMLALLLGGFALCVIAVYRYLSNKTSQHSQKVLRYMEFLSNRDFAYILVIFVLLGGLHWFLAGAAVGSYVFAFILWIIGSRPKAQADRIETGQEPAA